MGLKTFHLVFIAVSTLLAAFVAAWAVDQYRMAHEIVYALYGLGSVVAGGAMVIYSAAFRRKVKQL